MVACVCLAVLPLAAHAQSADLPNADLPGNSPSLPNSNLPGSMPSSNPIHLPSTDTSKAVTPWDPTVFPQGANVPQRNPSQPIPSEQRVDEREAMQRALDEARADAAAARQDAARARDDAAAARDEAADARAAAAALQLEREQQQARPPSEPEQAR
jgi:hypothetical protein